MTTGRPRRGLMKILVIVVAVMLVMCVAATAALYAAMCQLDNRVERDYTGWPDRMYVVGTDGRIVFKSGPGPFGFSTKDLEASLRQVVKTD